MAVSKVDMTPAGCKVPAGEIANSPRSLTGMHGTVPAWSPVTKARKGRGGTQAVASSEPGQASSRKRRWGVTLTCWTLPRMRKKLAWALIRPSGVIRGGMCSRSWN